MTESNLNLSQGSDDMPFSAQNIEQALDILTAEAGNLSDAQYQETALANVNLLRDLMRQTGVAPMMENLERPISATRNMKMKSDPPSSVGETAEQGMDVASRVQNFGFSDPPSSVGETAEQGMDVASRVQNLGFVDFTAGLINGTFDAIIGATIKQMEAYAKLVADLAKTLAQFQVENVSDAQINAHLSNRYPDGEGGTSIRVGYVFKDTTDAATGVITKVETKIATITNALIGETSSLNPGKLTTPLLSATVLVGEVTQIRTAISSILASNMMGQLRAMAREGMARIVITEGSIKSKLTFKVATTETLIKQASQYRANSLNASVKGYYSGKKWGASASVDYSRINVSTVNETNYDKMTMGAEIIAEVNINFKTETFAPFEPPTPTPTPTP